MAQENKRQINLIMHISCNKHSFLLNFNRYKQIEIERESMYHILISLSFIWATSSLNKIKKNDKKKVQ
jgi:hypothetical protein